MSPRPDVSEERKDQILDAASEVFADKGLHESRMDDIVAKSGLSKGTLYWYFKSKDDILIAIFDRMFTREVNFFENLSEGGITATEQLHYLTERVIVDINQMLRFRPITYEFFSLAFRRKFIRKAFKRYINIYVNTLKPIIQEGINQGEFREVDPLDVAIALGSIFEGTILLWVYDNSLVHPEEHIRKGIDLLLFGIKA